jgi:hypothetical protein
LFQAGNLIFVVNHFKTIIENDAVSGFVYRPTIWVNRPWHVIERSIADSMSAEN